ncbi:TonB-dependent receptor [Thalassotalea marina]|uniref:TonB-dependent receptor n=1 Tax=Thalassotalea marina TaxID=1673741 RepID=A0A919BGJ9_9GAMM|nr:TonB-dependent siderophore receptor [Thalassotalea marina]GHF89650.1 TonB-dependent receptor [Thalassotalea marina]
MGRISTKLSHVAVAMVGVITSETVLASQTDSTENEKQIERISIIASPVGSLSLHDESSTASRLGLSSFETPASIEIVDADVMRARGYIKLSDSLANLPGVVTGEHPTAPSTFSMRGFTRGQITVLRDGLWIGPGTMVMRPQNTFNLERIEVLRGPASVVNGVGTVGGTVNAITKSAHRGMAKSNNVLFGYGSHHSKHLGFSSQGGLEDNLWYTFDASKYDSDGHIERTGAKSSNVTASTLWQVTDNLSFKVMLDYLKDDVGSYLGTPLMPIADAKKPLGVIKTDRGEAIDSALKTTNFNVKDAYAKSDQLFLRWDTQWQLSDNLELSNTFYHFTADRHWQNAEGYVYCTQVAGTCTQYGEIQRYYGYFILDHDQDTLGNRVTLKINNEFSGIESRSVVGAELIELDFKRARGFRRKVAQVAGDGVDPFNPEVGLYGQRELRGVSPTEISTRAIFLENALQLTPKLNFVSGLRFEELSLVRENFNAEGVAEGNGFERDYSWLSWRVGATYQLADTTALYGQYSNAKDPINSNIMLVNNNQNFDLTDAIQWEVGVKSSWLDGAAETTVAYYDIERDDILERFALDSVTNVGGRTSNGVELSSAFKLNQNWRLGFNAAYTNAKFQRSANFQTLAGNTPPNVPKWTSSLWTSVDNVANLPLELGASVHYIGDRYGDNPNTVTLNAYTLTNLFAAYKGENYRITARIDNALDEDYVPWSSVFYLHQDDPSFIYANQLLLGATRSARVIVEYQF